MKTIDLTNNFTVSRTIGYPMVMSDKGNMMSIVTGENLEIGDDFITDYKIILDANNKEQRVPLITRRVTNLIEQRPAKGDYSGKSFKGIPPIFNKVEFEVL